MIQLKTVNYIEYFDLQDEVEKLLSSREGRKVDIRDYAGLFSFKKEKLEEVFAKYGKDWYTTFPHKHTEEHKKASDLYNELTKIEPPYQDFWHWWINNIDERFKNDSYSIAYGIYPEADFSKEPEWAQLIYNTFVECLPENMRHCPLIWYSW
jgi:hypothetical protein